MMVLMYVERASHSVAARSWCEAILEDDPIQMDAYRNMPHSPRDSLNTCQGIVYKHMTGCPLTIQHDRLWHLGA